MHGQKTWTCGRGIGRGRGSINQQFVVPTTVELEGTREALVQEISECGYVVSQNFLSLISSWR